MCEYNTLKHIGEENTANIIKGEFDHLAKLAVDYSNKGILDLLIDYDGYLGVLALHAAYSGNIKITKHLIDKHNVKADYLPIAESNKRE